MDNDLDKIAQQYRQFADREADGASASFYSWARTVAADPDLLARLATLPTPKRQPNLVFAALRWHGGRPGDPASLREGLLDSWDTVSRTILDRSTQTNEPARCAALLPLFHAIGGRIALIELGAAAGLCLVPDRYSYRHSDGTTVHPPSGASDVLIDCRLAGGRLPAALTSPEIVWRAGLDLNPLNPADPDTSAWLTALVWPEEERRRDRLQAALALLAANPVRIDRGDLRGRLSTLLAEAPADTTPVIVHSATLAYLTGEDRAAAIDLIADSGARWISFEGRGIVALNRTLPQPATPDTLFAAALDRVPIALANGHGDTLTLLADPPHRAPGLRGATNRIADRMNLSG
jgi:hypothetical protein